MATEGEQAERIRTEASATLDQQDTSIDRLIELAVQIRDRRPERSGGHDPCREKAGVIRFHDRVMCLLDLDKVAYMRGLSPRAGFGGSELGREELAAVTYDYLTGERAESPGMRQAAARWVGLTEQDLMLPEPQWRALGARMRPAAQHRLARLRARAWLLLPLVGLAGGCLLAVALDLDRL